MAVCFMAIWWECQKVAVLFLAAFLFLAVIWQAGFPGGLLSFGCPVKSGLFLAGCLASGSLSGCYLAGFLDSVVVSG